MTDRNDSDPAGAGPGSATGRSASAEPGARFLAVGDMLPPVRDADGDANGDADGDANRAVPADITYLPYAQVTAEALDRIRPDVVFSALVGPGFDCLDLAEKLSAARFRGKYRAVAPTVPNPGLVRREITDRFPELDFDLIVLEDRG